MARLVLASALAFRVVARFPNLTTSVLLHEDFEAVDEGSLPGAPFHPLDDSCQYSADQFHMEVSAERAHTGSKSLKITNKRYASCRLSGQFDAAPDFWIRSYMFWDPDMDTTDRETIAMDLTPGHVSYDDPAVRFGYRSKQPCTQLAGPQVTIIGIGGGEVSGCGARALPRGQWYCFEAHVTQESNIDVRTYINSEALTYQSVGKPQTESITSLGAPSQPLDHIRLGLFSTGEANGYVFVDDVVVATERIGCETRSSATV